MSRISELEAELERLREALEVARSREAPASNDIGIAGRIAITRLRDADYPELVAAVSKIPEVRVRYGRMAALGYCRTHVRSLLDAIVLQAPRTADLVRSLHRLHACLSEGQAELLMRPDVVGLRSRVAFLEAVERFAYAPSVRAAFARGAETPAGLLPPSYLPR